MITFHKLTNAQYEKMLSLSGEMVDGLYFLTDVGVIKLHNGEGSVTTFGTSVKTVPDFPDANNAKRFCVYSKEDTKEKRMWTGSEWEILSHPITDQITSGIALSATTTVPNTKAVYTYVQDRVAAAELGVQIKLHTPVYSLQQLHDLPLSDVQDKCLILVQSVGLYRYDANAYDYDDPDTDAVVTPKDIEDAIPEGEGPEHHPGRWIKMFSNMGYIKGDGISIEANPNDTNFVIGLNVDQNQFEFVDGKLTFKSDADIVSSKVDKISGRPDEIPIWNNDGSQSASGFKFNTTENLTNSNTTISPDSTISTFVHSITDKKLDDIAPDSDKKIIVGKGNEGKIDASTYNIGSDKQDFTAENVLEIPRKTVATSRAVKWYVDRCVSFNPETIPTSLSAMIDYDD